MNDERTNIRLHYTESARVAQWVR